MDVKKFFKDFIDTEKNLCEAQGITEILKQEYGIQFGKGYVFYLLRSIENKRVMPNEAEDSFLVLKCKEEFGE